jgi:hypothetical protein
MSWMRVLALSTAAAYSGLPSAREMNASKLVRAFTSSASFASSPWGGGTGATTGASAWGIGGLEIGGGALEATRGGASAAHPVITTVPSNQAARIVPMALASAPWTLDGPTDWEGRPRKNRTATRPSRSLLR